jgi:hypothetical protein
LRIERFDVDPEGHVEVETAPDATSYFRLLQGQGIDRVTQVSGLSRQNVIRSREPVPQGIALFRLQKVPLDASLDSDQDGLGDVFEMQVGLDPFLVDSNGDGISDAEEDLDGDTLDGRQEAAAGTDPFDADSDGDGWPDEAEVTAGSDPRNPLSIPNTAIIINGNILANGGAWGGAAFNGGSGGAVRLVAPAVSGTGFVQVNGGGAGGGPGRIRVDTIDRRDLRLNFGSAAQTTLGASLFMDPDPLPRLDIVRVASQDIPVGSGPVTVQLPFDSDPNITVRVRAQDFGAVVPIQVVLTPDSGPKSVVNAELNNTTTNPATLDVPVTVPVNTVVTIHVWKP